MRLGTTLLDSIEALFSKKGSSGLGKGDKSGGVTP